MKRVIASEKKPIKLWIDDIDEGALQQGMKSYITRGKENPESFMSCSGGKEDGTREGRWDAGRKMGRRKEDGTQEGRWDAGRKMGRRKAIRSLSPEDE